MKLKIPKNFLSDFFKYLYHSILPEIEHPLFDEKISIILEPICTFKIRNERITELKSIDKWLDDSFEIKEIRNFIKNGINSIDWSDLEQILFPPLYNNIFELRDNKLIYPGERFKNFINDILLKSPNNLNFIDGICHFHPSSNPNFSGLDIQTLKKFAKNIKNYKKNPIISLIIAIGQPFEYVKKSKESKSEFINYLLKNLDSIFFSAKIFHPNKEAQEIFVSIIN